MQYLYHRQKGPKQGSKLPEGLTELMSDITREVLRNKLADSNTYKFIADYIDALLKTRQRVSVSIDVIDEVLESSIIISDLIQNNGIDFARAQAAAKVIQDAFRRYVKTKEKLKPVLETQEFNEYEVFKELITKCDFREDELISIKDVIQKVFADFFRKYSKTLAAAHVSGQDTWPSVKQTIQYYTRLIPSQEKMDKAATKIQAYYRRYSCQKKMNLKTQRIAPQESGTDMAARATESCVKRAYKLYEEKKERLTQTRSFKRARERFAISRQGDFHHAATEIQSSFRGYGVRKGLACAKILETREIQDEYLRILNDKSARAANTATAAIQSLFRKKQKASRPSSWTDSKMDAAAQTIQDLWSDFAARRDFIRNLYRKALGEDNGLNAICDPRELPFDYLNEFNNLEQENKDKFDKSNAIQESLQAIQEKFDMAAMKTDIKALIKALGFSEDQDTKNDLNTKKYTFVIEKQLPLADQDAEIDQLQYDAINDELLIKFTGKDGAVTKLSESTRQEDSNLDRQYEVFNLYRTQPFDFDRVKVNMWNLIEKFSASKSSLGVIDSGYCRDCVYLIRVNRQDVDGSLHEDERITYKIDGGVMTVEHVDRDGNVLKRQDSLPAIFKGARTSDISKAVVKGMDIDAVKEQLVSMLKAFGHSEGPHAHKHGVFTINVEQIDSQGESTKREQKITYKIDGSHLTVEHIDMDGRKAAFEEVVPIETFGTVDTTGLDAEKTKEALEASLKRMVKAVTGQEKDFKITLKVSDSQKDDKTVVFELNSHNILIEQKLLEESMPIPAIKEPGLGINLTKPIDLQTLKENVKGIIKALGSSKEQLDTDVSNRAHGVYSVKVEQYNSEGIRSKEEEKITYDVDGGRVIIEHTDKDGKVTKKEEVLSKDELLIQFPPHKNESEVADSLKTHLKGMVGAWGLGDDLTGIPDTIQHGSFKIKVQHYDTEGGSVNEEERITYNIDGDQITTEYVGKDGTVTKRKEILPTEGAKIELPKITADEMVSAVKTNVIGIIKALGPPGTESNDQKRHGVYRVAVEHVADDGTKTEEKVTYNIDDGEVLLEEQDNAGNILRHHQSHILDNAHGTPQEGIETDPKIDLEGIKTNVKDMIQVIASNKKDNDANHLMHGTVAIKVEYYDPESGTTKEEDKFTYDIDNDKVEFKPSE